MDAAHRHTRGFQVPSLRFAALIPRFLLMVQVALLGVITVLWFLPLPFQAWSVLEAASNEAPRAGWHPGQVVAFGRMSELFLVYWLAPVGLAALWTVLVRRSLQVPVWTGDRGRLLLLGGLALGLVVAARQFQAFGVTPYGLGGVACAGILLAQVGYILRGRGEPPPVPTGATPTAGERVPGDRAGRP